MADKPEFLHIGVADAELRAEDEGSPKLVGYASKYGNWYPVMDFLERVSRGAFDAVLKSEETDVIASFNHDANFAFARQSAGTLRLRSNSVGLQYEADITDEDGRNIHDKVRNGTVRGSSFMFADVDDEWVFKEGEPPRRTITRVGRLYELGPVVWPANEAATVKARAAEILAEARDRHLRECNEEKVPDAAGGDGQQDRATTYDCECIECGHTLTTETHCKDIACPECGGEMRRKERPGPGRSAEPADGDGDKAKRNESGPKTENDAEISPERRREIDKGYRKAGRIIARCRPTLGSDGGPTSTTT